MSLENTFIALAMESGVIEDHGGNPEEITVITPATTNELELELEEVAEKITDTNRELDQVIESSDAIVSLEAAITKRVNQLRDPDYAKGYDRTQQALQWQMTNESFEAYKLPVALYGDALSGISFEAEEGEGGAQQAEKDAKSKEGLIARILRVLKAAAAATKQFVIRLIDHFRTSVEKNKRSVAILRKAKEGRDSSPKDEKMKSSGYSSLVVGGKVAPVEALKQISDGYDKHMKDVQDKTHAAIAEVGEILKRSSASGLSGIYDKVMKLTGARGDDTVAASAVLHGLLTKLPTDFSFELPGGRKGEFKVTHKSTGASTVTFSVTKITAQAPETTDTPSLAEVDVIANAIEAQLKVSEDVGRKLKENITVSEKILADAEALNKVTNADAKDLDALKAVVGAGHALLNVSKAFLPKYNEMALRTGHDAYRFGMAIASQYPVKK